MIEQSDRITFDVMAHCLCGAYTLLALQLSWARQFIKRATRRLHISHELFVNDRL
jgi:hypothetical protein